MRHTGSPQHRFAQQWQQPCSAGQELVWDGSRRWGTSKGRTGGRRYMADEARSLKAYGELPDNIRVNETVPPPLFLLCARRKQPSWAPEHCSIRGHLGATAASPDGMSLSRCWHTSRAAAIIRTCAHTLQPAAAAAMPAKQPGSMISPSNRSCACRSVWPSAPASLSWFSGSLLLWGLAPGRKGQQRQ